MGYLTAANRLDLIYLSDTVAMAHLLSTFADQAIRLYVEHDAGLLTFPQFDKALDELIDRLAEILRGENPRYMASPWFTEPGQLRERILDTHMNAA